MPVAPQHDGSRTADSGPASGGDWQNLPTDGYCGVCGAVWPLAPVRRHQAGPGPGTDRPASRANRLPDCRRTGDVDAPWTSPSPVLPPTDSPSSGTTR
jgi:hypothetical protein